jgi:methylenetetrahydrofolate dehydrogenase (NADP+)/methenyltetrahydrofolate cyclohydrolase
MRKENDAMKLLEAKPYREKRIPSLKSAVERCEQKLGRKPGLRVVLVGENPASLLYVSNKQKLALEIGIGAETIRMPAQTEAHEVRALIEKLNQDPAVDGILIQRPLPSSFPESEVLLWVHPEKDVDAFHPETVGRLSLGLPGFLPCTPSGCLKLLEFHGYDVDGKVACVVGRSSIVGKPLAQLLLRKNATVIHCHSRTRDLPSFTRQADFLFVAVGSPGLIRKEHVKPGAVVIDIGIGKDPQGKTVGDVDWVGLEGIAAAASPVPGGVGPMTILGLIENTIESALRKERS